VLPAVHLRVGVSDSGLLKHQNKHLIARVTPRLREIRLPARRGVCMLDDVPAYHNPLAIAFGADEEPGPDDHPGDESNRDHG
jgi:hypothetical protein